MGGGVRQCGLIAQPCSLEPTLLSVLIKLSAKEQVFLGFLCTLVGSTACDFQL
jgi:hypothetical protein